MNPKFSLDDIVVIPWAENLSYSLLIFSPMSRKLVQDCTNNFILAFY